MVNGTVTNIAPNYNNTFLVTGDYSNGSENYTSSKTLRTRKVVLATGMQDMLPSTPGIEENWGEGIFWCPWCDGHEHEFQSLGLLGRLDQVAGMAREILTLNPDMIAFTNGTDNEATRAAADESFPGWDEYLAMHNITIEDRTIKSITRLADGTPHLDPSLPSQPQFDLFSIDFESGPSMERAAFFASFPAVQKSTVGQEAGVNITANGKLQADPTKGLQTNIEGIYAIGDANSDGVTNVPHAMFSGKRTAVYLHGRCLSRHRPRPVQNTC